MVNPDVVPDDFPAWMHPRQRGIHWGLLIAALIGLAVGWAFFVRPGIPAITTGTHVGFMASDFASTLREGAPVPIWSPHAQNGYGAPIPQFTPQGAAYLTALMEVFFTDSTSEALRFVMLAALVGAGVGMCSLTSAWGLHWGIVAAALYVLSPFVGLTAPHLLADPSLMLAHAFLPALMWIATQLRRGEKQSLVLAGSGVLGVFSFIEPHVAVMGWLGGLVLLLLTGGRGALMNWFGIGLAGLGISAPLWLPALMLSSEVTWLPSAQPSPFNISVWDWLTPVRTPTAIPQFTLGLLLPLMMAAAWVYRLRWGERWPLLTVGTLGLGSAALGCWLFPATWWLSVGSFWAAAGGAGALAILDRWIRPDRRNWAKISATASLFAVSLSVLATPFGATTTDFSTAAQLRYEQRTGSTALLPSGQAIPSALAVVPAANPLLLHSYESGTVNRIPMAGGARVSVLQVSSQSNVWQVGMVAGGTLPVSIAYFPGWSATLDEIPVPVERQAESGLIQVKLTPTANGTLRIQLGLTPPQIVAWLAVIFTGMALGIYVRKP